MGYSSMQAYLEHQADYGLAELLAKGLRHEAKLMTAAQRFALTTYLVDTGEECEESQQEQSRCRGRALR